MEPNELVRREGLWFEASRFQHGKVIVFRDHEIGRRRNGTVAELVVVWINHHHTEAVMRLDLADIIVEPGQQLQQPHYFPPAFNAGELDGYLLVSRFTNPQIHRDSEGGVCRGGARVAGRGTGSKSAQVLDNGGALQSRRYGVRGRTRVEDMDRLCEAGLPMPPT